MEQCGFTTWPPPFFDPLQNCGAGIQPARYSGRLETGPTANAGLESLSPACKLFGMKTSRRLIYGILIIVAVGSAVGRILSTQLVFEPSLHRDEKDPTDRRRLWPRTRPAPMPTFRSHDRP